MLRTLLVDDEVVARRRMRRLLERERDVQILAECADGAEALHRIAEDRPDLVLLDVQMPELDGFEVIGRLDLHRLPAVVFVTAYDRYAMQAFDVHAVDYLLKPFSAQRFAVALERARERVRARSTDAGLARLIEGIRQGPRYLTRIPVRTAGRILLLDVSGIDWLEAADNYVKLHCGTRELVVRDTLNALESQLDPDVFVRIHRSTIVRADRVRELHPATHGDMDVVLRDGTRLTLSRTWRRRAGALGVGS